MTFTSKSTEVKHYNARASSLPLWTWILPFFIANLGTWLSIWFKTDPGASLSYLPTAFGIVMAYWWGPHLVEQLNLLGNICQNTIVDNWRILFSTDLATQFVFTLPILVIFTKFMIEKGWTQTSEPIPPSLFLPESRNSRMELLFQA